MADVLSQSEIDALLSALSTGELESDEVNKEEEKHKIKLYDFRSPQKFSKEHIRTLELIHDNYARVISNYLTGQTRQNVKVKIETVEQITYEEFIHSVQNPTIMTIFKMAPLVGTIILETNPQFSLQIIDVLLGGKGDRKVLTKEFTDIDKNIMRQITTGMINNLKLAWDSILEVEPEVETIETNPAINQTLAPNDPVALITFSVEMNKRSTFINMCIPYLSIEKILDKLVVQYAFRNDDEALMAESREKIEKGITKVDVEVIAELGNASITVDDFLKLTIGDVIKLDNKSSSPIKVYVGNEECYYAKPGVVGKNMGVMILDITDKEVNGYEQ
ncbi:flagellar motor switch protein FliM [Clostridium chromiireducens]|uniref:Flagellar motor switch protein FliM n=1 Tax=Clostridium chromiireducens TaxID=225345 RepID=A0A1V4IX55_9CLOT|nr:flagellar motor switch protein FliM [Clostridium chromiireducens]OPJ64536.1 flagellar motor switch protein FliM [Clostridium chromiireducens]RII36211.1 flagellar motor switch protein FliM [Clostridium chromiireducens]